MKKYFYIAASRGRPQSSGTLSQFLEIGGGNITHTITTVQKDNLIIELTADSTGQAEHMIQALKRITQRGPDVSTSGRCGKLPASCQQVTL